ncbi:MAG: DUF3006 domain-containing protein [Oscillospiraceae bacterium]|nr:DUF3006 domain-containing protein [Oscillospiraceae bacterium]
MMMIVDRFEADYAVLEVQTDAGELLYKNLPLDWLPDDIAEGDVLRKGAEGYVIDRAETDKRRNAANLKLQALLLREDA